ncbi:AI-2E family transporter [Paenibacillus sp. MMS20-IR301]|uniref:AI-2E family transporter n=1 Tax=Paenibacillus sp. MMS20-IR301 TaxID=2895946 RepID=UPI0028EB4284|nr:AI-2E family transporter [Paenibacillus sp. MMS20-IR301]WNS45295.1 AI-2E family transporter [Paenibacillus sp. MMS20-IR301]
MAKLNLFIRICIAVLLVLGIIYVGSQVKFIFTPVLSLFRVVIVPLMLAVFFYYLLRPLIDLLAARRLNRSAAILLVYVCIAILLLGFSVGVWPSLQNQLMNLVNNMPSIFKSVGEQLTKLEDSQLLSSLIPADMNPAGQLMEYLNKGFSLITSSVSELISFVSNFAVVLFTFPILLFYMLKEGGKFGDRVIRIFPRSYHEEGAGVVAEIDEAMSGFIVGRVLVNLALGVLMYAGFLMIGLPYALLLTIVAVLMNFIPFIGAILSAVPIFIFGLIESPSTAVWSIVVVLVAQQIQDNVVAPYIFGKSLDIHPLTTIILVLAGGDFGGIIGILLIIPVYMMLKIITVKLYQLFIRQRRGEEPPQLSADSAE